MIPRGKIEDEEGWEKIHKDSDLKLRPKAELQFLLHCLPHMAVVNGCNVC